MSSNLQLKSQSTETTSRLLDEDKAACLAGVTVDTIHRYRDFGLLRVIDKEGAEFFDERDIRNLFYTKKQAQGQDAGSEETSEAEAPLEMRGADHGEGPNEPHPESDLPPLIQNDSVRTDELDDGAQKQEVAAASPELAEARAQAESSARDIASKYFGRGMQLSSNGAAFSPLNTQNAASASEQSGKSNEAFPANFPDTEREALTQQNLSLKEQLEVLRQERDWLRQRVERLETRSEREQMLLLTESQTLKSVLAESGFGKTQSFWKKALPWFKD